MIILVSMLTESVGAKCCSTFWLLVIHNLNVIVGELFGLLAISVFCFTSTAYYLLVDS